MISKFDQFNEKLSIDTYKSAAEKLKKLGHHTRASNIEKGMNRKLTDYLFNYWLFSIKFIPGKDGDSHKYIYTKLNKEPLQGKLDNLFFDSDYFVDILHDDISSRPLSLSAFFKIDRSKLDKKTLSLVEDYIQDGIELFALQPNLGRTSINDPGKLDPKDLTNSNIDTFHGEFIGKFSDRKSAVEFKKALKNMLFNKIPQYGYDKDEHTDEPLTVSDSIRNSLMKAYPDATLEDVHDVYYKMCNINTNLLYTEDGIW